MYDLGLRLKEVRHSRGLTQKGLAQRINKSVSAVSSYESNAQMPPLDVLISIAISLNVSLDYLVGFDDNHGYSSKQLDAQRTEILDLVYSELTSPSNSSPALSVSQIEIIQKLILLFSGSYTN